MQAGREITCASQPVMKIAFLHPENEFTAELLRQLETRLPQHEFLSWTNSEPAPSHDLDLLIALGPVGPEQLTNQPKLGFVQTASTGYEAIDVDAASELGVWVSYAPSDVTGNATSVAEFAVLLILAASRRLGAYLQGNREPSIHPPMVLPALSGKTVCIVGLGDIGERIIERLRPFEMRIVATDEHPEHTPGDVTALPADQLPQAAQADYVVICVRASKENENLINEAILRAMKKGAILINIARGTLVDESALLAAVKDHHIAAAGLDVVREEPLTPSNPLLNLPQLIVTPHIAGFTDIMLDGTARYLAEVIGEVGAGKKPRSVLNSPSNPRLALRE